jgi:hypothetical protein
VQAGPNHAALTAKIELPESVKDFPRSGVDAVLKIAAPDLTALTAMLPEPLRGSLTGGGPITLRDGRVGADVAFEAAGISHRQLALGSGRLKLKASKRIDTPGLAPFAEMESDISADLTRLRVNTFAIDSATLRGGNRGELVTVEALDVQRAENSVNAQGAWHIPRNFRDAATSPGEVKFSVHVPKLADFGLTTNGRIFSGRVEGSGALRIASRELTGNVRLDGGDFQLGTFKAPRTAR